jgi:hypothetical protein
MTSTISEEEQQTGLKHLPYPNPPELFFLVISNLTSLDHLKKSHLHAGSTSSLSRSAFPLSYPGPTGLWIRDRRREYWFVRGSYLAQMKKFLPLFGPGLFTVSSFVGSPWTSQSGGFTGARSVVHAFLLSPLL